MASGGLDGIATPILDGNNYLQWKLRMRFILELQKIGGIVYGNKVVSAAGLKAAEQISSTQQELKVLAQAAQNRINSFKEREVEARTYLTCALDEKYSAIIIACKTANAIWTRIEQEDADCEPMSLERLLTEYYTCKLEPGKSISEYLAKVDSLVNKLAEHDRSLDEHSIMARIVSGLPAEYDAFKRMWGMTPSGSRTRGLLINNLKIEERLLKQSGAVGEALFSRSSSKPRSKSFKDRHGQQQGKCDHCGSEDHLWHDCPKRPSGKGGKGRKNKSM